MEKAHWEITALLGAWGRGDQKALEMLVSAVEGELRHLARRCLGPNRRDPILDSAALINEAYVRLLDGNFAGWCDRAHFFAACALIMRRVVVDHARASKSLKRGGDKQSVSAEDVLDATAVRCSDVLAIDIALEALNQVDPRKCRVVELRFFGGLTLDEAAEVLNVSPETVRRDWRLAKAWLHKELVGVNRRDGCAMEAN